MSNENASAYLELRWGAPSPLAPTVIGDGNGDFGPCVPDRMFIVKNNDLFSFDGAAVAYIIQDDPVFGGGVANSNSSRFFKTFNGKIFWRTDEAGTGNGIIVRSEDSGATVIAGGDISPEYVNHYDIDAAGNLYALAAGGATDRLIKSTDNGDSWTTLIDPLLADTGINSSVACHPTDVNRISFLEVANSVDANLRVSVDAGVSFGTLALAAPWTSPNRALGVGFTQRWLPSGRLVWVFTDWDTGALTAFWSDDDGASSAGSFELMDPATLGAFDGMWMDANGVLYVAATDNSDDEHIFRSPDGSTWSDLGVLGANNSLVQGMAFMADTMYVLNTAPEMWKIPTPGTTWVPELILDSGSASPFGDEDTITLNQDALVAACPP